jgi:hypothetical protein
MCAVSPVVHTSNISSYQKKPFQFPVAVNNSIKVGPLVFLLKIFVITENVMKRPVLLQFFNLTYFWWSSVSSYSVRKISIQRNPDN